MPATKSNHGFATLTDVLRSVPAAVSPEDWFATSALGRLVITPDGGPIRTIITGRKRIPNGIYSSRKCRCGLPHESAVELAFFHFSEVDTHVLDYRAQPFRFEFSIDGKLRTYIADCARLLADGSVEVVELKYDWRSLRDPDYAAKLAAAREACVQLGWSFRIVFRSELEEPRVRRANVRLVQSHRFVRYGTSHCLLALGELEDLGGEACLGDIADVLAPEPMGEAIAMAMMVGRMIDIDLAAPIMNPRLST